MERERERGRRESNGEGWRVWKDSFTLKWYTMLMSLI
jgi:hypothetical protein